MKDSLKYQAIVWAIIGFIVISIIGGIVIADFLSNLEIPNIKIEISK